jgi:hypothetical protein
MINTKEYILDLSMPEKVALFNELYGELAGYGTDGDTELAHVNTFEARLLKSMGGSGTINQITGLDEYKGGAPPPPATQTIKQTTEFPPELRPFIKDVLGEAQAEFQREKGEGFLPFPGPQIAAFKPEQQAAFETGREQFTGLAGTPLAAGETYARPALAATALGTSEVGTEDIGRRMDPFIQNVVDIAKREAVRDEEAAVQGRAAQAVGAGSFGGTRQALIEAEGERNLAERLGDIQARGFSTAFQNAQRAAEAQRQRELAGGRQFAALGDIAGTRARSDIAGLAGIGETQQQRGQQALDIARQEFQQEQQFPAQTLSKYQSVIRGFPYQMGFTRAQQDTVPTPSLAQTLTGGLTSAAGLYGMFGGFGGGRKAGGLVGLQGGGMPIQEQPQGGLPTVPNVGGNKMLPMVMEMYGNNPQFKQRIDQDVQEVVQGMIPQVQGANLGAGGAQVNLGLAGAPRSGGGLVSLAKGQQPQLGIQEFLKENPEATLDEIFRFRLLQPDPLEESRGALDTARQTYYDPEAYAERQEKRFARMDQREAERDERAKRRKEQALWLSLIAGGAGTLGADPQKGYAAAVGEGIKAGAPVAASALTDYAEYEEGAAERADLRDERKYEADEIGMQRQVQQAADTYALAKDRGASEARLAQLYMEYQTAKLTLAQYKRDAGIFGATAPDVDSIANSIITRAFGGDYNSNLYRKEAQLAAEEVAAKMRDYMAQREKEDLPRLDPISEQNMQRELIAEKVAELVEKYNVHATTETGTIPTDPAATILDQMQDSPPPSGSTRVIPNQPVVPG